MHPKKLATHPQHRTSARRPCPCSLDVPSAPSLGFLSEEGGFWFIFSTRGGPWTQAGAPLTIPGSWDRGGVWGMAGSVQRDPKGAAGVLTAYGASVSEANSTLPTRQGKHRGQTEATRPKDPTGDDSLDV